MSEKKRLNKYLSEVGYCSRRAADKLMQEGRVVVNNSPAELGTKVNEEDEIKVDNTLIQNLKKSSLILQQTNLLV